MEKPKSKNERIRETLIKFMKDCDKWNDQMLNEIPLSYEKYGVHLLFSEPAFAHRYWSEADDELWKLVCKLYAGKIIAVKGRIQNDNYRTPQVRILYGDSTKVNFNDNNIKYTWDITKNMFSAGNVNERHRIAKLDCTDEVIVDLFAGIGYFTLPYLVHSKAKFVHACEWNKNAIEALRRNLEINGVADKCQIYEGDNRKVAPRNIANRVNVGLIPSSEEYWQVACETLLNTGGILFIHQNITSKYNSRTSCDICKRAISSFNLEYIEKTHRLIECYLTNDVHIWNQLNEHFINFKQIEWFLFSIHIAHTICSILFKIHLNSFKVCVEEIFKVKCYAPHIDHIVYTVSCQPL